MGPSRFGSAGQARVLVRERGAGRGLGDGRVRVQRTAGRSADVVTDKLLVYFQNVCKAFTNRFKQLGGKIVDSESFTQGDKTINNVVTRVNGEDGEVIAFCTSFGGDQPAFVDGPAEPRQQDADHEQLGR